MVSDRRGALWSSLAGTVLAGIAVLIFGLRYAGDGSVVVGFGLGVATVGFVLSVGMVVWVYASEMDGESVYIYPATVASASALMMTAAQNDAPSAEPDYLSLALVGAAVLIIVGYSLVFVSQVWEAANHSPGGRKE